MKLSGFFQSWIGLYATQAFFHSLVASVVAEIALKAWRVRDPAARQRVLLVPVVAPVFLFPLYQLLDPGRGSTYFRLGTIFESSRWLGLEVLGTHPAMGALVVLYAITTLMFLFQEFVPILRQLLEPARTDGSSGSIDWAHAPADRDGLDALPVALPGVFVVDDDDSIVYSTFRKTATVVVSSGAREALTAGELWSAVAHELGHIVRNRHPLLVPAYLLRALMFFNPVALVEFRRVAQEEEKVCDEFAASLMRSRKTLADALRKLYLPTEASFPDRKRGTRMTAREIEERSHRLNIESRVSNLESEPEGDAWPRFLVPPVVAASTVLINYFVV
jgi:Zn-dependent protease with chaperone function